MAKQKNLPEDEDLTFLGQSIDPEMEKRVESFMEADDEPTDDSQTGQSVSSNETGLGSNYNDEASTAPLLPTDKLPSIAKTASKSVEPDDSVEPDQKDETPLATAPVVGGYSKEKVIEPLSSNLKKITVEHLDEKSSTDKVEEDTTLKLADQDETKEDDAAEDSLASKQEKPNKPSVKPKKTKRAKATAQKATKLTKKTKKIVPITSGEEAGEVSKADEEKLPIPIAILSTDEPDSKNQEAPEEAPEEDTPELANEEIDQLSDENEQDLLSDDSSAAGKTDEIDYNQTIEQAAKEQVTTSQPPESPSLPPEPTLVDDTATSDAIDDIIASDADVILGIEDHKRAKSHYTPTEGSKSKAISHKKQRRSQKESWLKTWWTLPLYRNLTFLAIIIGLAATYYLPTSRYAVMNLLGFRASTSLKVVDSKNNLPIKNIDVKLADKQTKTDQNGEVKLDKIKLGKQKLVISSPAFAEVSQDVVLDWGNNQIKDVALKATGVQVYFNVTDYASGLPVKDATLAYTDYNAKTDDKGNAILVLPKINKDQVEVTLSAKNYREEKISVKPIDNANQSYKQVITPAKKHAFVSKRSGKYDLYKVDVDGKDEQVVLSGTGLEKPDSLALSVHPTKNFAAFTSIRDNQRDEDGNLMSSLNLVNLDSKEVKKLATSERVQIIDWFGSKLVYIKVNEGAKKDDINRHKLISYDIQTGKEQELASSNYFNDVLVANNAIYYAPASYKVNGKVGLYKINADGSNKKTVLSNEVWNLIRSSFDKVSVSVGQDWYELNLSNDLMTKVGSPPASVKSRIYIANPFNQQNNLWVDERDGKSVLQDYQVAKKSDQVIVSESGLRNPVYWLSEKHVVYRVSNGAETADYVYSLDGGQPKKIKDVINTAGADRWYYFN